MSDFEITSSRKPLELWEIVLENVMALVRRPECVEVSEETLGTVKRFTVHVAAEDRGLLVGRDGRTIKSLRTLLGCMGALHGYKTQVEIYEESRGTGRMRRRAA